MPGLAAHNACPRRKNIRCLNGFQIPIIILLGIRMRIMPRASLVPRSLEGKAWGLLLAHARKISFIFRIIRRKISDNDVIVHGESARKEYADSFSTVTATIS